MNIAALKPFFKLFKADGLDDLSPEEVEQIKAFNMLRRIVPFYKKKGMVPARATNKEIEKLLSLYNQHKLSYKDKIYYSPNDFNKGRFATIHPVKKELLSNPETLFEMVKSSNLLTISYLQSQKTLEIEFKGGGRYRYYNVSIRIFNNLMRASSHGKAFWKYIRRRPYKYRRVA